MLIYSGINNNHAQQMWQMAARNRAAVGSDVTVLPVHVNLVMGEPWDGPSSRVCKASERVRTARTPVACRGLRRWSVWAPPAPSHPRLCGAGGLSLPSGQLPTVSIFSSPPRNSRRRDLPTTSPFGPVSASARACEGLR